MNLKSEVGVGTVVGASIVLVAIIILVAWITLGKHGGAATHTVGDPTHPPVPSPGAPGSRMGGNPRGLGSAGSYGGQTGSPNSGGSR